MKRGLERETETEKVQQNTHIATSSQVPPQSPRPGRVHVLDTLCSACFKPLGLCGPVPQVGLLVTWPEGSLAPPAPGAMVDSPAGDWGQNRALLHLPKT